MSNGGDRHPLGGGSDGVTATTPTTPTTTGTATPPQYDANGQLPGAAGYMAPPTVPAKTAPTPIRAINHPWTGDARMQIGRLAGGVAQQPYDPGAVMQTPGSPLQPAANNAAAKGGGLPNQNMQYQQAQAQNAAGLMGGMTQGYQQNYAFADGGAVPQAQGIAGMGRGQDSMLVHMTPGEVQSLQGIARAHGGSLTRNPQTGLYEAGWLSSILPMVAGGVLAATGVGAPLAAGMVAAEEGIRQKNWKAGLMAGLGAYGGAGLGTALAGAGASSAGGIAASEGAKTAAVEAAKNTAIDSASSGLASEAAPGLAANMAGATDIGSSIGSSAMGYSAPAAESLGTAAASAPSPLLAGASQAAGAAAPNAAAMAGQPMLDAATTQTPTGFSANMTNMGRGISGLAHKGGMQAVADQGVGRGTLAMAAAPALYESTQTKPYNPATSPTEYWVPQSGNSLYNPGKINPDIAKYGYLPQGETAFIGQTMNPGKWSTTMPGSTPTPPTYSNGIIGNLMRKLYNQQVANGQNPNMVGGYASGGGITSLAQGRLVDGPGDGTSDDVQASIDGVQPARLAKGEFVIPARIVSEIGNGSTEAGSQRLYQMMQKIENHRKRVSMAGDSNAEQYMPA